MHDAYMPQGYQDNEQNVIAHMSPSEIDELLKIQGRNEIDPQTGFHSFAPLGEYISHQRVSPHINSFMQNFQGQPRAHAGLSRYIEDSGQHGDTKAVILPRVLANLFDSALNNGQPMINPKTGKRQYFLGNFLGGLGQILSPFTSAISGMANKFIPGLGNAVSSIGSSLGNMASQGLSSLGNMASQGIQSLAPTLGNMASQGISSMAQKYGGDTGGQIANALSPAISNAVSGLASGVGQQMGGGQGNYGQTMQNAASQGLNALTPMAQQYAGNMAQNLAGNAMQGLANRFAPSASPSVPSPNPTAAAGDAGGSSISSMLDTLPEMAMAL